MSNGYDYWVHFWKKSCGLIHVVKKTALLKNCEQMQNKKKTTDFNEESFLFWKNKILKVMLNLNSELNSAFKFKIQI